MNDYLKYILNSFILYILINVILRKSCFYGNEKNIIMICICSSFLFYFLDNTFEEIIKIIDPKQIKKDFLTDLDVDEVLKFNDIENNIDNKKDFQFQKNTGYFLMNGGKFGNSHQQLYSLRS